MPKIRELSEFERGQIIAHHNDGLSQRKIAEKMKCSRCAVQTTLKRFMATKDVKTAQRSGRKKCTTSCEDRSLIRQSLRNRRKTSSELAAEFNEETDAKISARTVRRRLVDHGLRGCKARKKPFISETNKKKCLQWAKNLSEWTREQWSKVIWSDESNYEVC